jgi:hypothetical protein
MFLRSLALKRHDKKDLPLKISFLKQNTDPTIFNACSCSSIELELFRQINVGISIGSM